MNEVLWKRCIEFHGHECGGLAIGYRAAELALERLGIDRSSDEELVCVSENDACGVDAVQLITGCTLGKGNLILRATGKQVFTFYARKSGKNIRLALRPSDPDLSKEEKKNFILNGSPETVFSISGARQPLPENARIFMSVVCERCGEAAPEHKIRLENGQKLCLDCARSYSRGFDGIS